MKQLLFILLLLGLVFQAHEQCAAQIVVTPSVTATALAANLAGPGVTIINATLTCPSNAEGTFIGTSSLSFDSGIVLTNGQAKTIGTVYGPDGAASHFASTNNGVAGDAQLTTLSGDPTYDACILEFDFRPAGDTIKFKYVFGSEEYSCCTCSSVNDVFGFFISGHAYTTPTNIAVVPGTTIPVCVNSINCSSGSLCTSLGTGAPFCSDYVSNSGGTTIAYDGMTVTMTAIAAVTPCDTYHLKLAIADGGDHIYDSGVFLEAGSLSSSNISIAPLGLDPADSAQYCARGCRPGRFIFSRASASADSTIIHFSISGTAANGYDYTTIPDSVVIPAGHMTDTLNIYPLSVTPAGPKTITLNILSTYTCGGSALIIDSAQMVIYDSLTSISGTKLLCVGATTTLTNSATGGVWSSSSTGMATIGTASGIVTGIASGTSVISYSLGSSCSSATVVTVNPLPSAITGTMNVCVGSGITLGDSFTGGTWTSGTLTIATIGSLSGLVTGVFPGIDTITYSSGGGTACKVKQAITVNAAPALVTGIFSLCAGSNTTLHNSVTGGTWSTAGTAVSIGSGSGNVSALSAGIAAVTYTLPGGCFTTINFTVNALPALITPTVASTVCVGSSLTLSDATTAGAWSSGSLVSIGSTGIVAGTSAGIATVTYMLATGCYVTKNVTVNPVPAAISGAASLCTGTTSYLFDAGGTWSTGSGTITIGSATGMVTGISAGAALVTYTAATGCSTTFGMTVNPSPSVITGIAGTCVGATTTLHDSLSGGTWLSSDYSSAYIDPSTGVVTGIAVNVVIISYILPSGCSAITLVTVNPTPTTIIGVFGLCVGATTSLSDGVSGGAWTSSDPTKATVDPSTGLVTGIASGIATITYSMGGGCQVMQAVTINAAPSVITGTAVVCLGGTTTLADGISGGIWSSASTGIARIGSSTGTVIPLAAGTSVISYNTGTGCAAILVVTVYPLPLSIAGSSVCVGSTVTLTDASAGGTWSCVPGTVAGIGSVSGALSGIITGTATVTYTLATGCATTEVITVNALPPAISGPPSVCIGLTIALTDAGGGTWTRSNTNASVGSLTGVVTGLVSGTDVISYTLPTTGCSITKTITVNTTAGTITGPGSVCPGATIALSDIGSGTWSISPATVGTIGTTTGIVTGVAPGIAAVTYSLGSGCTASALITVNILPAVITGGGAICQGATVGLYDGTGGGTWSTVGAAGSVSSIGIVTGLSGGTAIVTYTIPSTGCIRTAIVTVNPLPSAIGGPTAVCVGATIGLTESGAGTWTSGSAGIATVGSASGIVTGIATGVANITFTLSTGCAISTTVTVSRSPTAITGPSTVCTGDSITLGDAVGGGVWTGSTGAATAGSLTGVVTGVASGTTNITYSLGTGCEVARSITVNPSPAAITGTLGICTGASTTLADATGGGIWSSTPTTTATITTGGRVSGIASGTAIIDYTTGSCYATATVTVNTTPSAVTGPATICMGSTITETDPATGGVWATTATSINIGSTTGSVTGVTAGTAIVTYSLGACSVSRTLTVNPIAAITGSMGVCTGSTTALADAVTGGAWSSLPAAVATIGTATGILNGLTAGTANITYTLPTGCTATAIVTVNSAPGAITGVLHVCAGTTSVLGDAAGGGQWSTTSAAITIGSSTGVVTGITAGTAAMVTYSLGSGCSVMATVTVNLPPPGISGVLSVCPGTTSTLTDGASGGTWASRATTIATAGSTTGLITGIFTGADTISYTAPTGCVVSAIVTVNPLPGAISGAAPVCSGFTEVLTNASTGGLWHSGSTAIAIIDSVSGTVTGGAAGTTVITYTLPTGCSTTASLRINAAPPAIGGYTSMCIGSGTVLTDASAGGVWNSGLTAIATIGSTGTVHGVGLGTASITYTIAGCPAYTTVTVNSLPGTISGRDHICTGTTDTLTDLPGGGLWSSSNPLVLAASATGEITGITAGIATITYSLGTGCNVYMPVTVNPAPAAITGPDEICQGAAATLRDVTTTGTWSSRSTTIATVNSAGVVTGVAGGTTIISFTIPTGCAALYPIAVLHVPDILGANNMCASGDTMTVRDTLSGGSWTSTSVIISTSGVVTSFGAGPATITYTMPAGCFVTAAITVNPIPAPVLGEARLCIGMTTTLTDATTGGVWSSSVLPVATVAAGLVTGAATGTSVIAYAFPITGCAQYITVTVEAMPSVIAGTAALCAGATTTLTNTTPGGIWTTGSSTIATIGAATGVVDGITAGTATITYAMGAGCIATKVVTVNTLPVAYPVTGGGNYCAPGAGVHIGLSNSATGVSYQLYNGSTATGAPITGTGTAIDFGLITAVGVYTVTATKPTTGCDNAMTGSATISTTPAITPTVNIAATSGITLCAGATAAFTSTEVNGGSTPGYEWKVNGTVMTGASTAAYSYTPTNGDEVILIMNSTAPCASPAIVTSNTVTMTVNPEVIPIVAITAVPGGVILAGENDIFTAVVTGGGATPAYQWEKNGVPIPGATSATYEADNLATGDTITCDVTSTGPCGGNSTVSNKVGISLYNNVGVQNVSFGKGLAIYPNPNTGLFTIKGVTGTVDEEVSIEITDMPGQVVYRNKVTAYNGVVNEQVQLGKGIAAGSYLVNIRSGSGAYVLHMVIEK